MHVVTQLHRYDHGEPAGAQPRMGLLPAGKEGACGWEGMVSPSGVSQNSPSPALGAPPPLQGPPPSPAPLWEHVTRWQRACLGRDEGCGESSSGGTAHAGNQLLEI